MKEPRAEMKRNGMQEEEKKKDVIEMKSTPAVDNWRSDVPTQSERFST